MKRPRNLVIAGGGTGGHLFPGIAVADAFRRRHPGNRVLFVATGRPVERRILAEAGYPLAVIPARGLKGMSFTRRLAALAAIPAGFGVSLAILRSFRPHVVLGVGGYSSGPAVLAARCLGIPTALQEQNLLPGITNRLLARLVDRIYTSFPHAGGGFPEAKVRCVGNPVRRVIADLAAIHRPAGRRLALLVTGGSQGAHALNGKVTAALAALTPEERSRWTVRHQTGTADADMVARVYAELGMDAEVAPFFTDMARRYHEADVLVCRSGATTVAEIAAVGRPALFVPFPAAADNHQELNARYLVDAGAAWCVPERELDPVTLAARLREIMARPEILADMATRARALGRPDAAEAVVDDLLNLR